MTDRDLEIITALARFRLLSFEQVHRRFFAGRSKQAARHRLRLLEHRGWIRSWREPVVLGGHPGYAMPSDMGLAFARDRILALIRGTEVQRLVEFMLPLRDGKPLKLVPGIVPPFLAHQRECNHLALRFIEAFGNALLWISTWERPFPNSSSGLALPQPDLVFVFRDNDGSHLVFLEHDRGYESLEHFSRAKVERYAELAVRPELSMELFGFERFDVWVTVIDPRFRRPLDRLRALSRVVLRAGVDHLFAFTLAGWAHQDPQSAIWSRAGDLLESPLFLGDQRLQS